MITGATFRDPTTGVTTTVRRPGGRRHLAVNPGGKEGGWCLQWATGDGQGGTHYDPPIERGFKTKREATARKRAILGLS